MEQIKQQKALTPDATIQQIIDTHREAEGLLSSIGLQPSQHSEETLRSVCQQRQWSEAEVLHWLKKHGSTTNGEASNNSRGAIPDKDSPITKWTMHLEKSFICPNRSLLKELDESFPRVHKVHGNQYPWLKTMQWHFDKFREALDMYYKFEQKRFFPLIERLKSKDNNDLNHGTIQKLEKSFTVVERDQRRLQSLMGKIQEQGMQFENPENACSTLRIQNKNFKILFSQLDEQFEVEKDQLLLRIKEKINTNG